MSRFYASIQGNRGYVTRMGSKSSGIRGHVRGWDIGAEVHITVGPDGKDLVRIYKTSGSNGFGLEEKIAEYSE